MVIFLSSPNGFDGFDGPGCSGGGPKRFNDSFDIVLYIVGECISCAADTHLATDLTCHLVAKFATNASGATLVPNLEHF